MKTKRYDDGGRTFSAEQEAWLGGADRTDPYILARMERAVPTKMTPATAARERVAAAAEEPDYIANIGRNYGAVDPADIRAKLDEPVTRTTAKAPAKPSKVTDTGDETARLLKRAPSSSAYPDESRRGSAKGTLDAARAKQIREDVARGSEAIESVYPEQMFITPGIKSIATAAKSLANRGSTPVRTAAQQAYDRAQMAERLTPTRGATSKASDASNARAATRRAEEGLNATEAAEARRRIMEASFEGGMKKGGAVKKMAKGGMTSMPTASKRADGIASKGKTKCKIY
jgi:hypothetical protein